MVKEWIAGLGIYLGPVMILIAELLFGVLLYLSKTSVRRTARRTDARCTGEAIYLEMLSASLSELHILVEHTTRRPLFATKNLEQALHISWDSLLANLECISLPMGEKISRAFWQSYNGWNQQQPLSTEFFFGNEKRWFRLTVSACADPAYDLFEFTDISEEKAAAQQMQEQLNQMESVSQSKTTFLSRMSHEIRTPMNGICGMLTLIESQPHNDTIEQYLQKADQLSHYLLSLINDILDISRIENGKLELEQKPFDLYGVVNELRDMFQKTAEAKKLHFVVETHDFQEHVVLGDRLRFSQVLINFISNAIKFTAEGEVRVTFREMMHDADSLSLMVRVHDTGIGMDPKFLERIFRPFEQEHASIATTYGGSGLGMAITEQIVHLMGGEIVIDTMPQKGSDFTVYVTFPLAKEQALLEVKTKTAASTLPAFTFDGKHILMAEDNDVNAEIATVILTKRGATVDLASNGQEVITRFDEEPAGTYDLILMDIQMPIYDGREATRRIRALDKADAKTIPIFALSADAFVEDERLSMEAGMNGHFAKPLNFDAMEQGIDHVLRGE